MICCYYYCSDLLTYYYYYNTYLFTYYYYLIYLIIFMLMDCYLHMSNNHQNPFILMVIAKSLLSIYQYSNNFLFFKYITINSTDIIIYFVLSFFLFKFYNLFFLLILSIIFLLNSDLFIYLYQISFL